LAAELRPDPLWGAYSAPPDPIVGFRGQETPGEGVGKGKREAEGR